MTPAEAFDVLDEAVRRGRWWVPWWRPLRVTIGAGAPWMLGQRGKPVETRDDGTVVHGFTASQCRRMLRRLAAAARADADLL